MSDPQQLRDLIRTEMEAVAEAMERRMLGRLRAELMALQLGDDHVMTEAEAAQLLGVSDRTMRRLREEEELAAGKIGRSPRYSLGTLRRFARRIATDTVHPYPQEDR